MITDEGLNAIKDAAQRLGRALTWIESTVIAVLALGPRPIGDLRRISGVTSAVLAQMQRDGLVAKQGRSTLLLPEPAK